MTDWVKLLHANFSQHQRGELMKGQWIGTYAGTDQGRITVELDETQSNYVGWAYLYGSTIGNNSIVAAKISTVDKSHVQNIGIHDIRTVDRSNGSLMQHSDTATNYPGVKFPTSADVSLKLSDGYLYLEWTTDILTNGKARLPKSKAEQVSELASKKLSSWNEFKQEVSRLPIRHNIFRGHRDSRWRLQTSFHRSGRADLRKYVDQDVRELRNATINLVRHKFDLDNSHDLASFYALLQHHGYPTPFLDWTYSPYVAAFFAFQDIPKHGEQEQTHCRILSFAAKIFKSAPQYNVIDGIPPHFSLIQPLAIENLRMANQQGFFAVTNLDDIEDYLAFVERETQMTLLTAYDLSIKLRSEAMEDLERMGITAASLFPGLEGVCRSQKERLF
jgi:FRG domain